MSENTNGTNIKVDWKREEIFEGKREGEEERRREERGGKVR